MLSTPTPTPTPTASAADRPRDMQALTRVSRETGLTPYSVKTAALAGHVRTVQVTGFPVRYSLSDTLQLVQTLQR